MDTLSDVKKMALLLLQLLPALNEDVAMALSTQRQVLNTLMDFP
jgi:hypothetical protein